MTSFRHLFGRFDEELLMGERVLKEELGEGEGYVTIYVVGRPHSWQLSDEGVGSLRKAVEKWWNEQPREGDDASGGSS